MQQHLTRPDVAKLRQRLRRLRIASWSAIEQGDCRAVARLTCEVARLQDMLGEGSTHSL